MSELTLWIDKLNGMTTEDIRQLMRDEGVTGHCEYGEDCPLAVFLRRKGVKHPSVGHEDTLDFAPDEYLTVKHSDSLSQFVRNFDNREYPELIDTDRRASW